MPNHDEDARRADRRRAVGISDDDTDTQAWQVFSALVSPRDYPCLGARSVLHRQRATVHGYQGLGSDASTAAILRDLTGFGESVDLSGGFASFVAVFLGGGRYDEPTFEKLLWRQLQAIRDLDTADPDPAVSDDPRDPHFAFSAGGRAYFVIGMHPGASRPARRSATPMVVFNLHEQFETLRQEGRFERMRDMIRQRDAAANGSVNPMVADHGDGSEARQYSGRLLPAAWAPPFEPHRGGGGAQGSAWG